MIAFLTVDQQPPVASNLFMTAITLAFVAIAVRRSQRMWRTLLYIVVVIIVAGCVGVAIGRFRGPEAAATFSILLGELAGISASIERISRAKKDNFAKG